MGIEVDLGQKEMVGLILVVREVQWVMKSLHVRFVLGTMVFGRVESFKG